MLMDGISRTRVFGISMMVYAVLSLILIGLDTNLFSFEIKRDTYVVIGVLLVFLGGLGIAYKVDFDKMYAIGIYAVTFGIFKILKAYSTFTMDFDNFDFGKVQTVDIMAAITIILSISFIVLGISFIIGESKKIWSRVGTSLVFIIINIANIKTFYEYQDWLMIAMMVTEIIVLMMFIALLVSKDVRINSTEAKEKYSEQIFKKTEKQANEDYAAARRDAVDAVKDGEFSKAVEIMQGAKKEKKETIAEGKKLAKDAKKVRYVYNPETKMVEVKKDEGDDGKAQKIDEALNSTKDKASDSHLSSKDKLEMARKKLDEESGNSK